MVEYEKSNLKNFTKSPTLKQSFNIGYQHDGVYSVTQNMKNDAPEYPIDSEIDIMPYYPQSPRPPLFKNYAAAEKDVLGLVWLTKIEIK